MRTWVVVALLTAACGGRGSQNASNGQSSAGLGGQASGGSGATGAGGQGAQSSQGATAATPAGAASEGGSLALAGMAGAEGGAAPTPALLPLVEDIWVTQEIQADAENFYYVTRPANEAGDIVRVSRRGGAPEVLVPAVGGRRADLQLYDGFLYYRSATQVFAYELATGQPSVVHTLGTVLHTDYDQSYTSLRAGPSGLYFTTYVRNLFRYDFDSKQVEVVPDQEVEILLKVEAEHLFSRAIFYGGPAFVIHDLATGHRRRLAQYGPWTFDPPYAVPAVDQDWYYRIEDDYPTSGAAQLERYPRSGSGEGMPATMPEIISTWEQPIFTQPLLWENTILILMLDQSWHAVSTVDAADVVLPKLAPCTFLFTGNRELFCAAPNTINQVMPEALMGG